MKINRKDIDLMAPVGSYESLRAAIQGGADSLYFGVGRLNMRARSSVNFTPDDLRSIVELCKENNLRSYLTLNIVFYDNELDEMKKIIDLAARYNVDAIIAADHASIIHAKSAGLEVHISTQVNISNVESVKFYAAYADVMILARELNLDQIKWIHDTIHNENITGPSGELIRLELFAHGALCMSVSGKCYLSLHNHNYSANRGECLQDCRRAYTARERETGLELDIENEYIMSPKDLCTIQFLNKIIDTGIRVLKIEGRARPPEYVQTVVECYNEAIHACVDGTYGRDKIENWKERLATVFNRGFWDGYYLGQKLGEWSDVYGSKATRKKVYIAKGLNYFSKRKAAEFLCEAGQLKVGDDIIITGPTTGVIQEKIEEIRVDLERVEIAKQGERFSIPLKQMIRKSDKLYKWVMA